ncbi:MAG: protein translocase subunit SecD [Ilumatobacteraceae bacterium]
MFATRRLVISITGLLLVLVASLVGNVAASNRPALGLDLQGGVAVTQEPVGEYNSESLDIAVERIRERVDALGVAEPEIIRQGDAVVVNLPGVDNQDEAIRLVQVTGAVLLRPVLGAVPLDPTSSSSTTGPEGSSTTSNGPSTTGSESSSTSAPAVAGAQPTTTAPQGPPRALPASVTTIAPVDTATTTTIPVDATSTTVVAQQPAVPTDQAGDPNDPNATVLVQNTDGSELYQLGPAFANGEVFNSDAQADIIQGSWGVRVTLKSGAAGVGLWNQGAAECYSRTAVCPSGRMAIVLDGVVQSAPAVRQPSFSGGVDITGNFSESEARDLARVLKSGALPVRLEVQAVQLVSPTLGDDSLRAAIISGLVGIALVLTFMLAYYRVLVLFVVLGLTVSGLIQWNVISLLSQTNGLALSLAGIAGIIVSVGITVDSYVVFFEKLKDEMRAGRTLRGSAERSFRAAWKTILTADVASLIGALTLWYLTVGSVRGFAFFLALSTLCDLVVSWFFLRPTVVLLARSQRFGPKRFFSPRSDSAIVGGAQ